MKPSILFTAVLSLISSPLAFSKEKHPLVGRVLASSEERKIMSDEEARAKFPGSDIMVLEESDLKYRGFAIGWQSTFNEEDDKTATAVCRMKGFEQAVSYGLAWNTPEELRILPYQFPEFERFSQMTGESIAGVLDAVLDGPESKFAKYFAVKNYPGLLSLRCIGKISSGNSEPHPSVASDARTNSPVEKAAEASISNGITTESGLAAAREE